MILREASVKPVPGNYSLYCIGMVYYSKRIDLYSYKQTPVGIVKQ